MHRVVALTALAWGLGHLIQPGVRAALPPALSAAAEPTANALPQGFGALIVVPPGAAHGGLRDADDLP